MNEGEAPFLDIRSNIGTNYSSGSDCAAKRRKGRIFHRIVSGLQAHLGEKCRFLTLTSCEGMKVPIEEAWKVFGLRVQRLTVNRLLREGYLFEDERGVHAEVSKKVWLSPQWEERLLRDGEQAWLDRGYRISRYTDHHGRRKDYLILPEKKRVYAYKDKGRDEPFRFDYFKMLTGEGVAGVFHIPYFGEFLPQEWVKDNWEDITGASIVDIRATKEQVHNAKKLAHYMLTQYVAGQDSIKRISWSQYWAFPGFVKVWEEFRELWPFKEALKKWVLLLTRGWYCEESDKAPLWYKEFVARDEERKKWNKNVAVFRWKPKLWGVMWSYEKRFRQALG